MKVFRNDKMLKKSRKIKYLFIILFILGFVWMDTNYDRVSADTEQTYDVVINALDDNGEPLTGFGLTVCRYGDYSYPDPESDYLVCANPISSWMANGSKHLQTGLEAGKYEVLVNDDNARYYIDKYKVNRFEVTENGEILVNKGQIVDEYTFHVIPSNAVRFIRALSGSNLKINKIWEGPVTSTQVTFRIRWKLNVEEDVYELQDAITKKGTDSEAITKILVKYAHVKTRDGVSAIDLLERRYFEIKGKELEDVLRRATVGTYEEYVIDLLVTKDLIFNRITNGEDEKYVDHMDGLTQNVLLDEEGYCYRDVTLNASEGWQDTLYGMIVPSDAEVIELSGGEGSKMSFTTGTQYDRDLRLYSNINVVNKTSSVSPQPRSKDDVKSIIEETASKNPKTDNKKVAGFVIMAGSAMTLAWTSFVLMRRKLDRSV